MVVSHIMRKWNLIYMASGEKGMPLAFMGKLTVNKMGFMIKDGVLVPKPPRVGKKRPCQSGVEPGRPSAGGGTFGGATTATVEGGTKGVIDPAHGVLNDMRLSVYTDMIFPLVQVAPLVFRLRHNLQIFVSIR
ncbi:hypothetical protein LIER_25135 [Lithospermum erythrorhizon]|uniref:Uncharacterized protein n=1 Tax=Lithospermum erythrorhizon TaxID=34254 RepID=A0AAV3R3H2_LITER